MPVAWEWYPRLNEIPREHEMRNAKSRRKAARKGAKLMRKAGIQARKAARTIDPVFVAYVVAKRNARMEVQG